MHGAGGELAIRARRNADRSAHLLQSLADLDRTKLPTPHPLVSVFQRSNSSRLSEKRESKLAISPHASHESEGFVVEAHKSQAYSSPRAVISADYQAFEDVVALGTFPGAA